LQAPAIWKKMYNYDQHLYGGGGSSRPAAPAPGLLLLLLLALALRTVQCGRPAVLHSVTQLSAVTCQLSGARTPAGGLS
jgi:hypothetical protein